MITKLNKNKAWLEVQLAPCNWH